LLRQIEAFVSDDTSAGAVEDLLDDPVLDCKPAGVAVKFQVTGTP
jgi:hypothetical protein